MLKHLMIGAAVAALTASSALAQNAPSSGPASSPPGAMSAPGAAGQTQVISSQTPDQFLSTSFKGTDVLGADDQKIGDVSDILFDKTGKIQAYVVSVGGFLGMGAKEVALAPSSFQTVPGDNGGAPKLKTSMTKDQLSNAQAFARYDSPKPASTTGSGTQPSGSTAPSSR